MRHGWRQKTSLSFWLQIAWFTHSHPDLPTPTLEKSLDWKTVIIVPISLVWRHRQITRLAGSDSGGHQYCWCQNQGWFPCSMVPLPLDCSALPCYCYNMLTYYESCKEGENPKLHIALLLLISPWLFSPRPVAPILTILVTREQPMQSVQQENNSSERNFLFSVVECDFPWVGENVGSLYKD